MDAALELASAAGTRDVNINDFYQGYKKLDLRPGELIAEVRIPLPAADELLRLYKVSRRRDLDIATFTAAIRMRLGGETIDRRSDRLRRRRPDRAPRPQDRSIPRRPTARRRNDARRRRRRRRTKSRRSATSAARPTTAAN